MVLSRMKIQNVTMNSTGSVLYIPFLMQIGAVSSRFWQDVLQFVFFFFFHSVPRLSNDPGRWKILPSLLHKR